MSTMTIDLNKLYPDASFVAQLAAGSTLHDRITKITDRDYLTEPGALLVSGDYDESSSMADYELVAAVLRANAVFMQDLVNSKDSPRILLRQAVFSSDVREVLPWQRVSDPQNRRTMIAAPLGRDDYNPFAGGGTHIVLALQKAIADHMLLEAYLSQPSVRIRARHVVCIVTDGYPTGGTREEFYQLRQMMKELSTTGGETWRFLAFGMAPAAQANMARNLLRAAGFDVSLEHGRNVHFGATLGGYTSRFGLVIPDDIQGIIDRTERTQAVDEWFATAVQTIADSTDRELATQYRIVERSLCASEFYKIPEGGFGFPQVVSSELTPGAILTAIGSAMSTTVTSAAQVTTPIEVTTTAVETTEPAVQADPVPADASDDLNLNPDANSGDGNQDTGSEEDALSDLDLSTPADAAGTPTSGI